MKNNKEIVKPKHQQNNTNDKQSAQYPTQKIFKEPSHNLNNNNNNNNNIKNSSSNTNKNNKPANDHKKQKLYTLNATVATQKSNRNLGNQCAQ